MRKYSTLTELAKALGVSPSTVSRALSDHPRISQKTRELVKAKAAEVGFVPNRYSSVLKSQRTFLVGLIVPDITLHFYSRVVRAMEHAFWDKEYAVVLGHTEESAEKEAALVDKFLAMRVDGVLSALSITTRNTNHYEKLVRQEVPLVFYDRVANFLPVPKVVSDDHSAAYAATGYLIESGCKKIAHITATKSLNNSNNRLYGYLDALQDYALDVDEELIFYYEFDHSLIHDFLDRTLLKHPDLDGIFVFNDYVANTVVQHLLKIGKKVPDEVSVIGFSGEPIATYMTPRLTTLEDVAENMGKEAANRLIRLMETGETDDHKIVLSQQLILRDTTN